LTALESSAARETFDIIVVDSGSRDESPQLDTDFPSVTFLRLPKHFGIVKALNIGCRTAKSEFLLLLHPSVEMPREGVSELTARLQNDRDAAAACPLAVDTSGKRIIEDRPLPGAAALARAWKSGEYRGDPASQTLLYPSVHAVLIRRVFLQGMRYLDERCGPWWDADLFFQIRNAGKKVLFIREITAVKTGGDYRYPETAAARAQLKADSALGAAAYLAKRYGMVAGLRFRISAALKALFSGDLRTVPLVAGGQRIDGSQTAF
jgi:GT2 family glycosyltransferase